MKPQLPTSMKSKPDVNELNFILTVCTLSIFYLLLFSTGSAKIQHPQNPPDQ